MAWVSGVFSRIHSWVNDRDANIKILATRHDAEDDNLAAGINNTLTKDGQNTATANLPMGNFRHTGVGNASARTDYASAAQIQDSGVVYATDTGTANTYAIVLSPAITAYTLGNKFWFKAVNTNTGASTINVNGIGAKSIVRTVSTALIAGNIQANGIYGVIYDGTNFQLTSQISFGSVNVLDRDVIEVDVVNTVTETALYSFVVPANTLGTNRWMKYRIVGDHLNNSASSQTSTFRIKWGASVVSRAEIFTPSATRAGWAYTGDIIAKNSTSAQHFHPAEDAENVPAGIYAQTQSYAFAAAVEDTTTAVTLTLTVQHDTADANISSRFQGGFLTLI